MWMHTHTPLWMPLEPCCVSPSLCSEGEKSEQSSLSFLTLTLQMPYGEEREEERRRRGQRPSLSRAERTLAEITDRERESREERAENRERKRREETRD